MPLYSKSAQNAVSILTYIARRGSAEPQTVHAIAENTGISAPTVAKTVQPLVKRGVLGSRKGPGGGFVLAHPAGEISLGVIVVAVEGKEPFADCVAGLASCSEDNVCPLHEKWEPVKTSLYEFLRTTTLEDMVRAVIRTDERAPPEAKRDLEIFPASFPRPEKPPGPGP